MAKVLLVPLMFGIAGCDRASQRIWNCSDRRLDVLKEMSTGSKLVESISPRSWISSTKDGAQVVSLTVAQGAKAKVIWKEGDPDADRRAKTAAEVCKGTVNGVAVQQY